MQVLQAATWANKKTLFRIRLRFFWPTMREEVKTWVKGCAHCISYNVWRSRMSELHFSWPITVPFWIMHVDLWSPGLHEDADGNKGYLMNSMCDITQFVVSSPTTDITAAHLAQLFMADVVLTFGMCSVVVIDDGSSFKGVFIQMCRTLDITHWVLSRGNHKGNSVEKYHRFLNKTQAISGNDRGTHDVYIQNAKTSQYAWNSAPIDDTDIVRSMAAIGRLFRFPLDVELSPSPLLNNETNSVLFQYLRDVSTDSTFSLSILQVLIDERRQAHRDRHNKGKALCTLKVGDVVKAHVQVQSRADTGIVGKLAYRARGPFIIVKDLGNNSFEVQRYGNTDSAVRKYKNTELYLLPPALFPSEVLDTIDQRYLDCNNSPIVSPLLKPMQIELYNDKWLQPRSNKLNTQSHHVDLPSNKVDNLAFLPYTPLPLPTVAELQRDDNIHGDDHHGTETREITNNKDTLHASISQSADKLFFISYTPAGTMQRRWYLVQVDIDTSLSLRPDYIKQGVYYCSFLAKHANDNKLSDELSRWWPDWYRYSRDSITNALIYGDRVLFRPSILPDSSKYISWSDEINLGDNDVILSGPFDFEKISSVNRTRSKVAGVEWRRLYDICSSEGLLPPTTGSKTFNKTAPIKSGKKTRKRKQHDGN